MVKKIGIKIGYEIKTGKEVKINLAHTVMTGITAESGKTTAIMSLIKKSGLKAIIMKTKIGEKAISEGSIIPPFYKQEFDWEYASELLESSRKEKLKFERSWIIKYSKTAKNLLEFKNNIDNALAEGKIRELEKSVLITLQAYLEKILPELQYAPLSNTLDIKEGINIMDLERFKEETQSLIIRSVLNEVLKKEKNTIVIIPEAWRYLPERLSTPVKRPAEAFIRQGATNGNYLFIDSQDITGISKTILKQVSNWYLGYQREINEIKRVLDQVNLPKKNKPKPEEIATLKLGQFFVATSNFTKKIYAQPSWLDDKTAKKVAIGKINIEDVEQPTYIAPYQIVPKKQEEVDVGIPKPDYDFIKKVNELRDDFISNRNDFFNKFQQINESISSIQGEIFKIKNENQKIDEDEIVRLVLQKIPTQNSSVTSVSVDEESLISKVLARVPSGAKVYEVAPLEKIKKDFLEEAKNKILEDIGKLSDNSKKTLKYLESRGIACATFEIATKGFLYPQAGGGYGKTVLDSIKELESFLLVERDARKVKTAGKLKNRIKSLLEVHEATEQEIENVYSHIIMEMLQ